MAGESDDIPISRGGGRGRGRRRGRGRGRGRSRRRLSEATNHSPNVQPTIRRRANVSKKKTTVAIDAPARGQGVTIKQEKSQPNALRTLPEDFSAGGKTVRNMFVDFDKYGIGGAQYLERGLTTDDRQFLDGLSALQMAIQYSYHAGKAVSTGWWAIKSLLDERRQSRALARKNKHLRSELERLRSGTNQEDVENGPSSSRGKAILIDLSKEEDNDWLEVNPSCRRDPRGKYPDSPSPPPPAAPLCLVFAELL